MPVSPPSPVRAPGGAPSECNGDEKACNKRALTPLLSYEAKVVPNGTTARMVLMFLRELVEQPVYPQYQQTYGCPMMKCYEKFSEPFQLVQHLLSCAELPNGEFDCDKCNNWHEFPTNEKDWSLWSGWSSKFRNHSHTHGPDGSVQRKRSFSSKMRETFTLRK